MLTRERLSIYRDAKLEIDEAIAAGTTPDEVEELLWSIPRLDPDQRSALWLYAWHALAPSGGRGRFVRG